MEQQILLPSTVEFEKTDDSNTGLVLVTPCEQGYGTTIGNALRRVLLSSLPGSAVETVKINGVQHEFATIDGVKEDVVEIILNLKQVAVKNFSDVPVVLHLFKKGNGDVVMGDFEKNADVEVVDPDFKIATITDSSKTLEMDITIGKGRGYVSAAQKNTENLDLGTIVIDSLYSPVRDVGYKVENTRVGDVTDYEKLILTVSTNGTITPKEAVLNATQLLVDHLMLLGQVVDDVENVVHAQESTQEFDVQEENEQAEDAPEDDLSVEDRKEPEEEKDKKKTKTIKANKKTAQK